MIFLGTSSKLKSNKLLRIRNLFYKDINEFNKFNTLIIDAEGDEEYYVNNLKYMNNIQHLFFELHYNIFNNVQINKILKELKKSF